MAGLNNMQLDISVIAPCFNQAEYLERCLTALEQQMLARDRYEIIVIDNNSTDDSVEIVQRFAEVQLLHESKLGSYAARNTGVRKSRGEILAFIDPDCVPQEDWLERILIDMRQPEVQIVLGRRTLGCKTTSLVLFEAYENQNHLFVFNNPDPQIYFGHTNNMAVRKSCFDQVGFFEEVMRGGDTIFVHRVLEKSGVRAVIYDEHLVVQHLEINSIKIQMSKKILYADSFYGLINKKHTCRLLSRRENMHAFLNTIKAEKLSIRKSIWLWFILLWGWLYWNWGAWRA